MPGSIVMVSPGLAAAAAAVSVGYCLPAPTVSVVPEEPGATAEGAGAVGIGGRGVTPVVPPAVVHAGGSDALYHPPISSRNCCHWPVLICRHTWPWRIKSCAGKAGGLPSAVCTVFPICIRHPLSPSAVGAPAGVATSVKRVAFSLRR